MQHVGLICFPFAGAGASFFRPWQELDARIKVVPVQLPGREELFLEPPLRSVQDAIDQSMDKTLAQTKGMPVVIFGHSLGAALAFEMAHRARDHFGDRLKLLVASGSDAPLRPRRDRASGLSGDAFIAKVRELSGYADPALENEEIKELILPTLHADVSMHENYAPTFAEKLDTPVLTLRGSQDHLIDTGAVQTWAEATTGHLSHAELPGGHMYVLTEGAPIIKKIAGALHLD